MKIWSMVWKLLLGSLVVFFGWTVAKEEFGSTQLTGGAVLGVSLIAVGVSVLSGAFDIVSRKEG